MSNGQAMTLLWKQSNRCIRLVVAITVLWTLTGCVTSFSAKPDTAVQKTAVASTVGVVQLDDGRDGFRITETSQMSADSRQKFTAAAELLAEEKYENAIVILEKVIEQSPGVTAPYVNLGIAYQRVDKLDQAEAQFKTALEMIPGHPVACNEYGLLARKNGRFDEARILYGQALTDFPNYYPIHRNLGILCDLYLNDQACALEHYEIYSNAMPDDTQVKMWIADLRGRMGHK